MALCGCKGRDVAKRVDAIKDECLALANDIASLNVVETWVFKRHISPASEKFIQETIHIADVLKGG